MSKISVETAQVKVVFTLLEKLHHFFHQPENYEATGAVDDFLKEGVYEELSKAYYDIVWHWLPEDEKKEIEDR